MGYGIEYGINKWASKVYLLESRYVLQVSLNGKSCIQLPATATIPHSDNILYKLATNF